MIISGDVNNMQLSARAWHCLVAHGLCLIKEIDSKTDKELLSFKNLGKETLREIRIRSSLYKKYQLEEIADRKAFLKSIENKGW